MTEREAFEEFCRLHCSTGAHTSEWYWTIFQAGAAYQRSADQPSSASVQLVGQDAEAMREHLIAAAQPSVTHSFCGPFPEQSEDERTLRYMLALRCGEPGELYGDDGELQLGGLPCPIDFRRDSVQEIRRKLDARDMAKLIKQQRAADNGETQP